MEDERKTKKQLIEELNCLRLKQIEQTRITSEKFTKAFLQNSIPTIITLVKDDSVVEASDAFLRLVGLKRHEIIGHTSTETGFITKEQRATIFNELKKSGRIENLEMEIRTSDGTLRYGLFNAVMMSISNENCLLTTVQDITDRKKAESQMVSALEELKEQHRYLRTILDTSKDGFGVFTDEGIITEVNESLCNMLGYKRSELLAKRITDILIKESPDITSARLHDVIAGSAITFESHHKRKDGSIFDVEVSLNNLKGSIGQFFCFCRDITDRKQAEEELAKSEEKYRVITENIMDCIFLIDANGVFQYATNHKITLGYELEDLIGITGISITHPDELERIQRIYEGGVDQVWHEITYETRLRHKDGHYVPMEIRGRTFTDHSGDISGAVFSGRQITQIRQISRELSNTAKLPSDLPSLNSREKEILNWVMQGKSTWDISVIIDISERTVKFHIDKIMKKLSAVNRTHAVAIAMSNELLN